MMKKILLRVASEIGLSIVDELGHRIARRLADKILPEEEEEKPNEPKKQT